MDSPKDMNQLCDEKEVCEWLGLAVRQSGTNNMLSSWIKEGLNYIEKSGKKYFFVDDILEFVLAKFEPT